METRLKDMLGGAQIKAGDPNYEPPAIASYMLDQLFASTKHCQSADGQKTHRAGLRRRRGVHGEGAVHIAQTIIWRHYATAGRVIGPDDLLP